MSDDARDRATGPSGQRAFGAPRAIVWTAIVTVVALVAALAVQVLRTHRLQSRLDDATMALAASRAHVEVEAAVIAAQQGNLELARQRASTFFSGLQEIALIKGASAAGDFNSLLARRDSTITILSRGSPESVALLLSLSTDYEALQRSRESPSSPGSP